MPATDTPYIIGTIREKEKGLLSDDEYTRIIGAPSSEEAIHVLNDTPYAVPFETTGSAFEALTEHLRQELAWLHEMVIDKNIIPFITARYDGLLAASACSDFKDGKDTLSVQAPLASISSELMILVLWHGDNGSGLPQSWEQFILEERERMQDPQWTKTAMLERTQRHVIAVMKEAAITPLMQAIAQLTELHLQLDREARNAHAVPETLPAFVTQEAVELVAAGNSATAYEKEWDEELLRLIREHRHEPMGYDPILGYWYAKEVEAKTLRLLFFAKLAGLPAKDISPLTRSLYADIV